MRWILFRPYSEGCWIKSMFACCWGLSSLEREEMFHRDDNKLHGSFLAICREEGGDLLVYKAESISMNKCCISAGPVTWSASPLLMNSPYFTPTQMNIARKRRKLADSNIPTLYLLTATEHLCVNRLISTPSNEQWGCSFIMMLMNLF